jgi:hypothetical protein
VRALELESLGNRGTAAQAAERDEEGDDYDYG